MRTSISLDGTEGPMYPTTIRTELPGVVGAEWALHAPAAVLRDIAAACTAAADIAEMVPTRDGDVCGDIDEDDRCTRAPGHAGSHGNGVAAWEHFPTRDGDDLADWIDPIVKGAVAP